MTAKVVLITGASSGIGLATAELLHEAGFIVYGTSRRTIDAAQYKFHLIELDVNKDDSVAQAIAKVIQNEGRIDVLINNAGISQEGLFTDVTEEEWQKIINTNLNSVFYCNQQALKYMIQEQQGCIINISSIWGETGASCEVAYSTTKAAINGMTKALAKEVGPSNIRVNAIAPGIIDTDMNRNLTNEELEQIKEQIPLNKIGKALDIAKCVKWLIEDEYTTGQIISINGGWYI